MAAVLGVPGFRGFRCGVPATLGFAALAALFLLAACSSPNRGTWRGTFAGSVSGTVEFQINARGTSLTGKMDGATQDGNPFKADMEGKLRGDYFYASFKGSASSELRPIPFEGFLKGSLAAGKAGGDWECQIRFTGQKMNGTWKVEQVKP